MAFISQLYENSFIQSGDKKTFYWSAGPANGPLIILIHGWPANGETWKPQLLALSAIGFRTIAPDCRGYGRSSIPGEIRDYAIEEHVSDMLALLQHLGREKALWIGHDWGAALVWSLAAHHPNACVGVACLAVPLSDRNIYPEAEFPYAQWDYQKWHEECPEESARQLERNVAGTVRTLYGRASPAHSVKPALWPATVRKNGGWWGGADRAPDTTSLEETALKDYPAIYDGLVAGLKRNGFEGPNAYYLNHDVNAEYAEEAMNDGYLCLPVLFIGTLWESACDTTDSQLADPMRHLCKNLTECNIEAGHWVGLEKPLETNAAILRWIATKLPTYFPYYWKTPFVSQA